MAGKPIALAKQRASTVRFQEDSDHQLLQFVTEKVAGDHEVETEIEENGKPGDGDNERVK